MARLVFLTAARQVWGAEESMLSIGAECAQRGIETALVCFGGEVASRFAATVGGEVYVVTEGAPASEQKVKENLALWRLYWRHAARGDRVVIFTYYLTVPTLVMLPLARVRGVRLGLDLHDNLPGSRGRALLRSTARGVDAVIACSAFTAGQVAGHPRVQALNGPIDDRPFAPASRQGRSLRVGIVGRIVEEKRHLMVIDAVARCDEGVCLVVRGAGDGSSADNATEVRQRGQRLLGTRFRDEGRVSPARALADLDAVVIANPREPMGRTALEAQLQGVVAIVPTTGGASGLVRDGVTGFHFRADDPADLARVLGELQSLEDWTPILQGARESVVSGNALPERYTSTYLKTLG